MKSDNIYVGQCDPYFMVQWLCLISQWLFDNRNVISWILVPCDMMADLKIYACQLDLYFMVQWFFLVFQSLFDGEIWILVPCDIKSNLKIYVGHCDLHFTVQWVYLVFRRLFHRECHTLTSVWPVDWHINISRSVWLNVTYISSFGDFA